MRKLDELISKLKSFEDEIIKVIEEAIRANEDFIVALNYEDQLYDGGVDRDDVPLKPPYAESTVKRKKRKNQITSHVTLRDEGIFHKSFYIYYGDDNFEIMTSDPIEPILKWMYNEKILGLTDTNKQYVFEKIIAPAIENKLKKL